MSEHPPQTETHLSDVPTSSQANEPAELFNRAELKHFDSEDRQAGGAIGKMLALFFLYTVIAMSAVAYWTFSVSQ